MEEGIGQVNSTGAAWIMDWLYGGVDFTIKGNGGEECANYLPLWTRTIETVVMTTVAVLEILWGWRKVTFEGQEDEDSKEDESSSSAFHLSSDKAPVAVDCVVHSVKNVDNAKTKDSWPWMKRALLVLLCMVFGIEIGYKFATKSVIYLLNPCHMLTFMQIYLLASDHRKNCKTVNTVFRIHLYLLNGALLAMIFYVVNTRFLPFEQAIYWIQHGLLYLVPIYLISLGGSFTPDRFKDIRWPVMCIGVCAFYHFAVLQSLAMLTNINLNNMLCPAVSDPFEGEHYRKWASAHQHLMIALHGKLYVFLARLLIRIMAAVQSFCVAVTVKSWKWTIHLVLSTTRACKRSTEPNGVVVDQDEQCLAQKRKLS